MTKKLEELALCNICGRPMGSAPMFKSRVDDPRMIPFKDAKGEYWPQHESCRRENATRKNAPVSPSLRKAVNFFRENAGYVVGEKAKGALDLARAEQWARDNDVYFEWHDDDEARQDYDRNDAPSEVLYCVCKSEDGKVLSSLGAIEEPDRKYRRVVEAELALEAMSEKRSVTRKNPRETDDEAIERGRFRLIIVTDTITEESASEGDVESTDVDEIADNATVRDVVEFLKGGGPWDHISYSNNSIVAYPADSEQDFRTGDYANEQRIIRGAARDIARLAKVVRAKFNSR